MLKIDFKVLSCCNNPGTGLMKLSHIKIIFNRHKLMTNHKIEYFLLVKENFTILALLILGISNNHENLHNFKKSCYLLLQHGYNDDLYTGKRTSGKTTMVSAVQIF